MEIYICIYVYLYMKHIITNKNTTIQTYDLELVRMYGYKIYFKDV